MRPVRAFFCALIALVCLCFAAPAVAGAAPYVLYGATGGQGVNNSDVTTSDLFRIDPATGATTTVGPLGQSLTGLAYNPVTGVLYGVTTGASACERCLVTVNQTTGAATVVGPLFQDGDPEELDVIAELAFRDDGVLFGWSENGDDLARINLATGATTHVGDGIGSYGDAMDFTAAGVLYVFPDGDNGQYYTVDSETGEETVAGTVDTPPTARCDGGAAMGGGSIDPLSGDFFSTRTDNCGGERPYPADLVRIDLATGVGTRVGALPDQTDAIEFVPQPDLAVTKTGPASAASGQSIDYSVTVRNNGPGTSFGPVLTDALPAGTTFVSLAQTAGPAFACTTPAAGSGGTVTCTNDRLAEGASATFSLTLRTNPGAQGGTVENTASAGASSPDGEPSNNSATATTSLSPSADLSESKTGAPARVRVGDVVRYTVTATNNGPSDAQSVVLTDALARGTTFVSATQASGPPFACTTPAVNRRGTIRCTSESLPAGASASFTFAIRVGGRAVRRSSLANTARISSATNDAATANNSATARSDTLAARLRLTKRAARSAITAGQSVRFRIRVAVRRTAAVNLRVCDRLPDGMVFVSAPGAQINGRTACFTVRRLGAGKSRTFVVTARAERGSSGRLSNRATAAAAGTRTAAARVAVQVRPSVRVRSGGVTG